MSLLTKDVYDSLLLLETADSCTLPHASVQLDSFTCICIPSCTCTAHLHANNPVELHVDVDVLLSL